MCGRAERRNSRPSIRVFRTSRIGKPPRRPLPFGSSVEALMAAPTQVNDLSWLIGGPQGSGVDSSANVFARACAAGGLYVFGRREFYSNIIGEHSYCALRADTNLVRSHIDSVIVVATFRVV